jgi:hypothetical protein
MSYLTGKRVERIDDKKTGVIVSEPFREFDYREWGCRRSGDPRPASMFTAVAVLWDGESMEGAVDIETLKIVEEEKSNKYAEGKYILLVDAHEAQKSFYFEYKRVIDAQIEAEKISKQITATCRIAKLHFIE